MDGQGQVRTGVAAVDAVIASVESLAERPLAEHAEVFTTAQERLRRALDADPDAGLPADDDPEAAAGSPTDSAPATSAGQG
jgi:hypothetical protein